MLGRELTGKYVYRTVNGGPALESQLIVDGGKWTDLGIPLTKDEISLMNKLRLVAKAAYERERLANSDGDFQ